MSAYKKLLITGFEPFGGEKINPSWEAVKRLPDIIGGFEITKLEIPVVFDLGAGKISETCRVLNPDAVLCIGQYGGTDSINIEMVAVNLRNGTDSDGHVYSDSPVVEGAPAAYFSTLPVRRMESSIKAAGIKARTSFSAGTYVCNDVFYSVSHRFSAESTKTGFIHVPYIPEQNVHAPTMPLETIVHAIECAISAME